MICVTGLESNVSGLLKRLEACGKHGLQEVRLDAMEERLPAADHLPISPRKLLITCRRISDGGFCMDLESDRIRRIEEALEIKPGWIDVEADLPEDFAQRLITKAHSLGVKVLRSVHLIETAEAGAILKSLAYLSTFEGDGIKLAAAVDDVIRLEELFTAPVARPAVLIGMGPAGILTRALHTRFRSAWTYVSAHPWPDPDAGIPDLEQARLWGMPVRKSTRLFVLLGGPSIVRSPGPAVYNRFFRERDHDALYLPAITEDVESAFNLLSRLGFAGASVTIPHKMKALNVADALDRDVRLSGALNTLFIDEKQRRRGANTDIAAIRALVERLAPSPLKKGVVIGTGGLARACALALSDLGIDVSLIGRKVLLDDGPWAKSWPLSELPEMEFDILVNATPVGSDPDDAPIVPEKVKLGGKVVIDGVLSRSPTALVARARKEGAHVADGIEFWCEQGAQQMALFKAPHVSPEELAEYVDQSRLG